MIDTWWKSSFASLLNKEQAGTDPLDLEQRWLVLAGHALGKRRHRLSFDVPNPIYHVLEDADARAKSPRYAEQQWALAREWLNG